MTEPSADLAALAAAHGVATSYRDADDAVRTPPASTVRAVLQAMDVPCATDEEVAASLAAPDAPGAGGPVAPTTVIRTGTERVIPLRAPTGADVRAVLHLEGGGERTLPTARATSAGGARGTVLTVGEDVGLGAHVLELAIAGAHTRAHVLVVPARCPVPEDLRAWGWQVQLYALRSRESWGIGDLGDLRTLVEVAGEEHGADLVLLNPLHAAMPVMPQQPSPYYPSSRRAWNPLYLRVEECDGWAALAAADPGRAAALQEEGRRLTALPRIERDPVFDVKDRALRLAAAQPLPAQRAEALAAYRRAGGRALDGLALAFALATRHGGQVSAWPAELRDPRGPAVDRARRELAGEIEHQIWLQWQCDEQLAAAERAAAGAGMRVGLVTDLAVGVDADGADGWSLAADMAQGMTVGAPPDALAQRGQDWRLPPLRPDRLAATGYAAFREIVRANLRHAGGLRIDHVMGLFRLYWIPEGAAATDGTYVYYDIEAMLGVLALEAQRAGAVIVGEDLGTVEEGMRETLAAHGVLGSAVFWFERPEAGADDDEGEDRPARSDEYRRLALTSVTTHDLPTVAGWLRDEPTRLRGALDQLATDEATERRRTAAERAALLGLLEDEGVLAPADREDVDAVVRAVHAFAARTPSLLVTASLADAVGDLRQPNLPGTVDEYPNWRLPVATPDTEAEAAELLPAARSILLGEILADPRVPALAAVIGADRLASRDRLLRDPQPVEEAVDE